MRYKIDNENHKHNEHVVELRETVIHFGLMKAYCVNCNKQVYVNPDDLKKIEE